MAGGFKAKEKAKNLKPKPKKRGAAGGRLLNCLNFRRFAYFLGTLS
jgi:hypothetical protein